MQIFTDIKPLLKYEVKIYRTYDLDNFNLHTALPLQDTNKKSFIEAFANCCGLENEVVIKTEYKELFKGRGYSLMILSKFPTTQDDSFYISIITRYYQ
jgi:hypothetical protein